jgi:hypothetical protein
MSPWSQVARCLTLRVKSLDLRGVNICKLNGDLVGHLSDASGADKHLDRATDRLFPDS